MSWTGYNSSNASIKTLIQQESDWISVSFPITSEDVERINSQIYAEINLALDGEDIDLTVLTATDLQSLSLINDMGTAGMIEKIKFNKVPQVSESSSDKNQAIEDSWTKKYQKALENFIKAKKRKRQNSSYSGFGCHSTVKATTPLFERDQQW